MRNPEARESGCKLQVDFICGQTNPVPMAKTKHDAQWAKAKHVFRLNMEDIRMAKELGLSPQNLIKIKPSPSEPWKLPVKDWIGELYKKRFGPKAPRRT
jgi:hypothetical protein